MTATVGAAPLPKVLELGRVPVMTWAAELEPQTLEQATNLSNLPFAIRHVALMPDAHSGYGMPIGGVLFSDGPVVPYAIGVDIGCGVALAETDLTVGSLARNRIERVLQEIDDRVPTGTRSQKHKVSRERAEEEIGLPRPVSIKDAWWDRAVNQLGTLGSGNHFIELQRDGDGNVYVMLHSGSRNLGKQICDEYARRSLAYCQAYDLPLPHRELAYLPPDAPDHVDYWAAMEFALRFAEVNRSRMLEQVRIAFDRHTGIGRFERTVEIHHNYATWENHFGRPGIVHRKGAVRARRGELVVIPGSMGTASYVGDGLGNADAFESSPHGAGRAMSRGAARKQMTSQGLFDEMRRLNVLLYSGDPKSAAEEAPYAYKDIEQVMAASADLARPLKRLTPLGVVKG